MEKVTKKVVAFVFIIFITITSLIFVFNEFSTRNLFIILGIIIILALYYKFPILTKWQVNKAWPYLLSIVAISLFLRITWIYLVRAIPISDFYTYHSLATALSEGGILYEKFLSLFPHVFGYSKVLSVIYSLFGSNTSIAVIFNILLNLGILLLVYYIAKSLFDEKIGIIASAIYAFWPSQIFYNPLVLTEPFFTFGLLLLVAAYLYMVKQVSKTSWRIVGFLAIGVAAGFLKFIRPATTILIISLVIHYLFLEHKYNPDKQVKIKEILCSSVLCLLLIASSSITSRFVLDSIENTVGVETAKNTSGFYILAGLNVESDGRWSFEDSAILESLIAEELSSEDIHAALTEMGIQRLKEMDLITFIRLQINKNTNMWGNDNRSISYIQNSIDPSSLVNITKHSTWLLLGADAYYFFFLVTSCLALLFMKNGTKEKIKNGSYILYLYTLGTVAAHLLVEVHSRYHYSVIPLLCIPAAVFLTQFDKNQLVRKSQ